MILEQNKLIRKDKERKMRATPERPESGFATREAVLTP